MYGEPRAAPRFSPSSRARLTAHDVGRFPGATLFDRLGRALCQAGCLARKELYESWEVARRARRLFRGGRVVDLGGGDLDDLPLAPTDIVVSAHACGALTDRVRAAAIAVRAPVAVLPCCHDEDGCDAGGLTGWLDTALAIDVQRVTRLTGAGYLVRTQTIPASITPRNRLILAGPA